MSAFTIGSVQIQVYGLLLAVGVAAAICWAMARCRGMKEHTVLCFALFALPLGFLLARLGQCLVSQGWYLFRENYFFNFRRGGFMLYGALGGTVLAAWIASKIPRQSFGRLLDAVSAPGMLVIAVCRFAEGIIGVGYGRAMEDWFDPWGEFTFFPMEDPEPLLRFPFGIPDYYGDYHFSIFLLEGLAAVIFLLILARKRTDTPGALFLLGLILYAGAQTTLESLRADSLPKWGFVRVNQLLSGVTLALALGLCTRQLRKAGKPFPAGAWIAFAACLGMILAMEFALEKKILFLQWMRMDLCYLVMALSSLGLILIGFRLWRSSFRSPAASPRAPA